MYSSLMHELYPDINRVYINSMPPSTPTAPTTAEITIPGANWGATFCRPGLLSPLVAAAEGTTATHEVEVIVVTPPLGRVEVKV